MSKLNLHKSVLLVDASYWIYYRFFALRRWYFTANPEKQIPDDYNWLADEVFMAKYEKLFFDGVRNFCADVSVPLGANIIFCIDCPHKEIWRLAHCSEYKGTRVESHKRNNFSSYDIFTFVKQKILPTLIEKYKINVLLSEKCEADDLVGTIAPYLIQKMNEINVDNDDNNNESCVYIMANDKDYIQICNSRVKLFDGNGKNICEKYNTEWNNKYLMSKILMGDVSDNIMACEIDIGFIKNEDCESRNKNYKKCTKAVVAKLLANENKYTYLETYLTKIRQGNEDGDRDGDLDNNNKTNQDSLFNNEQFKANALLIDFQLIPNHLKQNIFNLIEKLL